MNSSEKKQIADTTKRYRYAVEVNQPCKEIMVDANTSQQARTIAHKHGYTTRSVNRVG